MKNLRVFLVVALFAASAGCTNRPGTPPTVSSPAGNVSSGSPAAPRPSPSSMTSRSASPVVHASRLPAPRPTAVDALASSAPLPQVLRGHGVIKSIDADKHGLTIEHDVTPELHDAAGVTHYRVSDAKIVDDLHAGDEVDYDVSGERDGEKVVSGIVEMGR